MQNYFDLAEIIVTHGGPATFIEALLREKTPIVVPRQQRFGEHVNNHQIDFVKEYSLRQDSICPVYDIKTLESTLLNAFSSKQGDLFCSNTGNFCKRLGDLIASM